MSRQGVLILKMMFDDGTADDWATLWLWFGFSDPVLDPGFVEGGFASGKDADILTRTKGR